MYGRLSLKIRDLNEHLTCTLCGGYYVDATTIIECLHSFCRSCIVNYLTSNKCCPKCDIPSHTTRPLLNLRSDETLQDVVYKLIPTLHQNEVSRKRKFETTAGIPAHLDRNISFGGKRMRMSKGKSVRLVNICLENDSREVRFSPDVAWKRIVVPFSKRYLRCVDAVTVATINKLVRKKLSQQDSEIITFCRGEVLSEYYSLMDVANTFSWKSDCPLLITYMTFLKKTTTKGLVEKIEERKNQGDLNAHAILSEPEEVKMRSTIRKEMVLFEPFANSGGGVNQPGSAQVHAGTKTGHLSATSEIKFILPKTRAVAVTQPTNKSRSDTRWFYSVMNLPLINANGEICSERNAAEKRSIVSCRSETYDNVTTLPATISTGIQEQFAIRNPIHSRMQAIIQTTERTKSINSIAQRLQMRQQMQLTNNKIGESEARARDQQIGLFSNVPPGPGTALRRRVPKQFRSMYKDAHSATGHLRSQAKPTRLNTSSYKNLTNDEAHNLALECVRSAMRPILPRLADKKLDNIRQTGSFPVENPTSFIHIPHSKNLLKYGKAADQRGNSRQQYSEFSQESPIQSITKSQRFASAFVQGDILSTTRQLASLRQQQKILNEIAARVAAGSNSTIATSESIMAAASVPSSRNALVTSIQSVPHASPQATHHMDSNSRPRVSFTSSDSTPAAYSHHHGNGFTPASKHAGTSFVEFVARTSNVGYSYPNTRGVVDIYQNTIEKAKACVREMDIKSKAVSSTPPKTRSSAAPYIVPRSYTTRKLHSEGYAPKPTMLQEMKFVTSRPGPSKIFPKPNWRISPTHTSNKSPHDTIAPAFRPPNVRPSPSIQNASRTDVQPEQEQPLCLVVRK